MEIVKYICEFFFTNFWHWLGGLCYIAVVSSMSLISFNTKKKHGKESN